MNILAGGLSISNNWESTGENTNGFAVHAEEEIIAKEKERIYKIDGSTNLALEPEYGFSFMRQYSDTILSDLPSVSWKLFLKCPWHSDFKTAKQRSTQIIIWNGKGLGTKHTGGETH